jgi:hypothetical protein
MTVLIDYTKGFFETTEGDTVGTVTAGTGPYNLAVASYDNVSFSVGTQETLPMGLFFKPDGTKVYIIGQSSDTVFQYSLSTAWDVSTASYDSVSFSVSSQESYPSQIYFKPDGTKFYVIGFGANSVFQYGLSTAWDLSTASYDSVSFSVSSQTTAANGLAFKPDGTKFYVCDFTGVAGKVYEYSLSTAWDLSTASYVSNSGNLTQEGVAAEIIFNPDGTKLWLGGPIQDKVFQYSLSTAWDITTISYDSVSFSVSSQENNFRGFNFKTDGSKLYAVGWGNNTIFQYSTVSATTLDLSTGSVFSYTPTANTTFAFSNPPASGTASSATLKLTGANVATGFDLSSASYDSVSYSYGSQGTGGEAIVFKPDGTKMFILNTGDVDEYTLSTAWDLSTVSYDSTYDPSEVSNALGLQFSYDGTKFYIADSTNDDIYQYNMTTAWDVSTASYANKSLDVSGQEQVVQGLDFKTDGTKLFIIGTDSDQVREYNLSTAWDISTASYVGGLGFSVSSQDTAPLAIRFNSDGTKFFILGYANDTVYQYSLSTAWDTSTASYDSVSFSIASQETFPRALGVKSDGTKMYIAGSIGHSIYQYSTSSSALATITYPSSVIWSGGTTPTAPANGETDVYTFYTDDGGTTYYGFQVGDALA